MNCFLFREGNSDEYLLPRLLQRGLADLCDGNAIEIAPVTPLRTSGPLVASVCDTAVAVADTADLFFYHYDGSADVVRETQKYWEPLRAGWAQAGITQQIVPVVPVREMEAWAVGDLEALKTVARSPTLNSAAYEYHKLNTPERLADPKRTLADLVAGAPRGRRRARSMDAARYLTLLSERISLDALRRLGSFQDWERDTTQALRNLRIIL